jgi:pilus assembly protein CpaD
MHRYLTIIAACFGIVGLSGCLPERPSIYSVETKHPIVVNSEVISLSMPINPWQPELQPADLQRLDALVNEFVRRGGGVLEISVVAPGKDSIFVLERANRIRRHAMRLGVLESEIRINSMRGGEKGDGKAIVVSYERFSVDPVVCGNGGVGGTHNTFNKTHPNFGCTTQANLAAMVSNPSDLVRSRERQAPDANVSNKSIDSYRGGGAKK